MNWSRVNRWTQGRGCFSNGLGSQPWLLLYGKLESGQTMIRLIPETASVLYPQLFNRDPFWILPLQMPLTSKTALLLPVWPRFPPRDMILVELSNIPRKQCGLEQDSWIPGNLIIDCFAGIRRKSDLLLHTYTGKDTSSMDEWRTRAWPCCRVPL